MSHHTMHHFGHLLRHLRLAAGLSQEELAERAGLSTDGIRALEAGRRATPRPYTVRALADALALAEDDRLRLTAAAHAEPPSPAAPLTEPPTASEPGRFASPPRPPTRLIGREREAATIAFALRSGQTRLMTLTGTGGVGKTRLALAVAEALAEYFPDGVVWIELAHIIGSEQGATPLVAGAIARALGTREPAPGAMATSLATAIDARKMVLVLDNFEHLLGAAQLIAELLSGCPALVALVTSRERLHVRGERELAVQPLAVPDPEEAAGAEATGLHGVAAVRLFVERAVEVRGDFALTEANTPAVASLCRQLDGLPLAIELAVRWVKVLPPEALAERLVPRLPLLAGGGGDLPDRQQTMWNTIAWSYQLLQPEEQRLFRRLGVFAGGFTLEAAEAIGGDGGPATLTLVTALVDKSLVRSPPAAASETVPRFGMLETIREFALEQLAASSEEAATRDAHAGYFLALVADARASFEGPGRSAARDRVEREHDNLRAAVAWALASGDAETAQRLGAELARFWVVLGYIPEGRDWLEQAVALDAPSSPATRVDALLWAANFAASQDALARADVLAEDALALARSSGYRRGVAMALYQRAQTAERRDDHERATALYEAALAMFRELAEPIWEGVTLRELGLTARARGDHAKATARHEEALAIWRRLDHPWGVPAALRELAHEALQRGDLAGAAAQYGESLKRWRQLREPLHIGGCLWGLARVALATGRAGPGARLLGAASALDEALGIVPAPDDRAKRERAGDTARAALGEAAFKTAWIGGRALPLEEAIAEALALADILVGGQN